MKATRIARSIALASALAGAASGALAATDGTPGATSTGKLPVSVKIPARVQISNLNDISLQSYAFNGQGMEAKDDFCVYSNTGGSYNLTATSGNPDVNGEFQVSDGTNDVLYSVMVDDSSDPTAGSTVTSGQTLSPLQNSSTSMSCNGGTNASLQVSFTDADLQAALAGTYQDTITLVVAPE